MLGKIESPHPIWLSSFPHRYLSWEHVPVNLLTNGCALHFHDYPETPALLLPGLNFCFFTQMRERISVIRRFMSKANKQPTEEIWHQLNSSSRILLFKNAQPPVSEGGKKNLTLLSPDQKANTLNQHRQQPAMQLLYFASEVAQIWKGKVTCPK